jgi:hypothetical protein
MAITSSLSGGSSISDQLGTGHIVAGSVTATAGTDAVITCNDQSAVLTRAAAGNYTVTFGEPFIAAPVVTVGVIAPTFSTATGYAAQIVSAAAGSVVINVYTTTGTTVACALADADFTFIAVGKRYN